MKTKKVKLAQRLPSNLGSQQPREGGEARAASSLWPPRLATRSLCLWGLLFLDSAPRAVGKAYGAVSDPHPSTVNRPMHATGDLLASAGCWGEMYAFHPHLNLRRKVSPPLFQ